VLGVSCKGISEATQTMEKKPSVTVTLTESDGILPNTAYTVYAVAANAQSLVSAVKSVTVLTTDKNIPSPVKAAVSSTSAGATVTFNETVSRGEGKAFAHYYKVWAPGTEAMKVELGEENIVVDGAGVTFSAPDTVSGAYVFFTWEEGLVKNAVGTKCPEYQTVVFSAKNGAAVTSQCRGIMSRWPVTTFGWTRMYLDSVKKEFVKCPEDSLMSFVNPEDAVYYIKADSTVFPNSVVKPAIAIAYVNDNSATIFKELENFEFDLNANILALGAKAGTDPDFGDNLVWSVAEDSFVDVWGNTSAAYANGDNYIRSYGYEVDDFCGIFAIAQYLVYSGKGYYCNDTITISKTADKNIVNITGFGKGYFKMWSNITFTPESIDCVVDPDLGILTFPINNGIGSLVSTKKDYGKIYMGWMPEGELLPAYLSMKQAGVYSFDSSYPYLEYCYVENEEYQWYDYVVLRNITKLTVAPTSSPQSSCTLPISSVGRPKYTSANTGIFKY